ncbi:hypothetical protein D3C72_2395140 [compost metagenome]
MIALTLVESEFEAVLVVLLDVLLFEVFELLVLLDAELFTVFVELSSSSVIFKSNANEDFNEKTILISIIIIVNFFAIFDIF